MAKKVIQAQMQQRRDTAANWAASNPVLLDGEMGIVTDDPNLYKVGDGVTAWNDLKFRGFDGTLVQTTGDSENAVMSQKAVTEKLTELESEIGTNVNVAESSASSAPNLSKTLVESIVITKGHKYTIKASADAALSTNLIGFYLQKQDGSNIAQLTKNNAWDGAEISNTFTSNEDTLVKLTTYMGSQTESGVSCNVVLVDESEVENPIRQEIEILKENITPRHLLNNIVNVAAFDSSDTDKANADYICDGVNDEEEINAAINDNGSNVTVNLFKGTYYIDSFGEYEGFEKSALVVKPIGSYQRSVLLKGQRHYFNGTRIVVREGAFNSIATNDAAPSVFNVLSSTNKTGTDNEAFWYVSLQDLFISVPNYNNPCVIVNLQNAGCGEEKNLRISAFGHIEAGEYKPSNYNPLDIAEGLVGIRAFHGWTYGDTVRFDNICVWGCWHGFELGAEHMIVSCCRSRYNYCGWTFGSYYKNLKRGAFDHPITLINCCDEKSLYGPKFEYCGLLNTEDYNIAYDTKLQCITFIDWNMETPDYPAEEVEEGTFCGTIQYSAGGGTYGNSKNVQFWKEGSGKHFRTINSSHAVGGTTIERLSYTPNYMQQYYDTDKHKMLVYDGNNWVDYNGQKVD